MPLPLNQSIQRPLSQASLSLFRASERPLIQALHQEQAEEQQLLARARTLDQAALAAIHDRYYSPIYRYIAFRVHDEPTAEDLTSEVFMQLLAALRGHRPPQETLRGWLFGTAANLIKDYYRKKRRANPEPLNETIPSDQYSLEQQLAAKLSSEALQTALQALTQEQQHVLALRFGQGMAISDVAVLLGKSIGSVKMLQARGVAALAQLLNLQDGGEIEL